MDLCIAPGFPHFLSGTSSLCALWTAGVILLPGCPSSSESSTWNPIMRCWAASSSPSELSSSGSEIRTVRAAREEEGWEVIIVALFPPYSSSEESSYYYLSAGLRDFFFLLGTMVVFFFIVVRECGPPVTPACWAANSHIDRGHQQMRQGAQKTERIPNMHQYPVVMLAAGTHLPISCPSSSRESFVMWYQAPL